MKRNILLAGVAVLGVGITAAWFWQHREREPAAPSQEQSVTAPMPQAAVATVVPAQAESAVPQPLSTALVANDMEARNQQLGFVGKVLGKSGAMQMTYPDLARELGITPEQAEALFDLLMNHADALSALTNNARRDGVSPQELERARAELKATQKVEFDAAIAGHEPQWREYQPTLDARRRVSELTVMLASTSPVSESQQRQLVATVVAEQRLRADAQAARGTPANNPLAQLEFEEQNLAAREQSNRRTVEAMRNFLTEPQISVMESSMNDMNRQIRASLQARRAQLEGGTAPQPAQTP